MPTSEPSYGDDSYNRGARQAIYSAIEHISQDEGAYLWYTFWQIVLRVENRIIGEFDFHHGPDENGIVSFGYMMRPEFRNQGYMTEAAEELVSWALKQTGVLALVAERVEKANLASQRVLEKLGARIYEETDEVYCWRISK
jgi:RimJ/RimL family protein N-acetyltransferase